MSLPKSAGEPEATVLPNSARRLCAPADSDRFAPAHHAIRRAARQLPQKATAGKFHDAALPVRLCNRTLPMLFTHGESLSGAMPAYGPEPEWRSLSGRIRSWGDSGHSGQTAGRSVLGRVEMWRGCCRSNISVSAPFVWRCLSGSTMAPFPHPAHRTGQADFPHPALGQDLTPSPTARRARAPSGVRARSARKGARVDKSRPCVA
jgi:hypothetical protein